MTEIRTSNNMQMNRDLYSENKYENISRSEYEAARAYEFLPNIDDDDNDVVQDDERFSKPQ